MHSKLLQNGPCRAFPTFAEMLDTEENSRKFAEIFEWTTEENLRKFHDFEYCTVGCAKIFKNCSVNNRLHRSAEPFQRYFLLIRHSCRGRPAIFYSFGTSAEPRRAIF